MKAGFLLPRIVSLFCRIAIWIGPLVLGLASLPACAQDLATQNEQMSALIFGLLVGVVLAAAAYLFFIWAAMRDRGQALLIIFLLCIAANIASTNDLLMNRMGFYDLMGREFLTDLTIIASWIFGLFFTYYFLELDTNNPGYKFPFLFIAALLLLVLIYSLIDKASTRFALPMIGTVTIAAILIAGLSGIRNGTGGSIVHVIAFTFFLGGALAEPAYILGLINTPEAQQRATYISFALSAMMFATVVASQFAARQEEKEKALALSNERFMLATRGANEGLFDWNLATGEIFFSDQLRKILGVRDTGIGGMRKWMRMMVPTDRRVVSEALRRFRRNAKTNTLNVEYRVIHMDGERRWLHSKAVAVRDKTSNKLLRLVGSTSDVTARKQSEVALRTSEMRFRSITEAHPVPVLIISLNTGAVFYASPGAETMLGLTQQAVEKQVLGDFLPAQEIRQQIMRDVAASRAVDMVETDIIRNDGTRIAVAVSARRITYQNENAMVIGLYDLTERRKAEAQIAQQQEALQQSEKMAALGGLLAGVAHELNNPLSVVVGQATLLMEGAPEPKIATRAEKIFKAADRCSRIVKSFLALARRKAPERKPVDLNQVVKASLELLGYQLKNGDIELDTQIDPHLPDVIGDGDQLTQVITNLVLNAAQAMEGWKFAHRIKVSTSFDDNRNVILKIADSGPGVPPEIRSRIFEPFFTTKGGKGGTGVGLALCINIVAAHGGEMLLSDTPGGGATFTIIFPPASGELITGGGDRQAEIGQELKPARLLLVDDEVELAQTLADLLEPEGHKIDIAANGAIAMEKLQKQEYDAIVSDLRMPVMDGPALYEALKAQLPSYLNRIIYVTGDTLSPHVHEFLSSHAVPVVEKPYRLKDIRRALIDLLQNAARK